MEFLPLDWIYRSNYGMLSSIGQWYVGNYGMLSSIGQC